jgi:A/G-specific adenine glycosylase
MMRLYKPGAGLVRSLRPFSMRRRKKTAAIDSAGAAPGDVSRMNLTATLERWFRDAHRLLPWRERYDAWEIWVSEVMLQQTRVEVVVPYFRRFIERFPRLEELAAADLDEVVRLWSGLGYYRRARMLHDGARHVVEMHGGRIPAEVEELRRIPGIGRYTAGAISSIAFDRAAPIVDGNVARLLSRLHRIEGIAGSAPFDSIVWQRAAEIASSAASPRSANQALMELGAMICRPLAPACGVCPVAAFCQSRIAGEVDRFPAKKPRAVQVAMTIPLFVVRNGGRILLIREESRLMNGLFHLPHGSAVLTSDRRALFIEGRALGSFRHTVTNRKILFELVDAVAGERLAEAAAEAAWVSHEELAEYPHPSYVKKAFAILNG